MVVFLKKGFEKGSLLWKKQSTVALVTGCGFCRDAFVWIEIRCNTFVDGTVLQRNVIIIFIIFEVMF